MSASPVIPAITRSQDGPTRFVGQYDLRYMSARRQAFNGLSLCRYVSSTTTTNSSGNVSSPPHSPQAVSEPNSPLLDDLLHKELQNSVWLEHPVSMAQASLRRSMHCGFPLTPSSLYPRRDKGRRDRGS